MKPDPQTTQPLSEVRKKFLQFWVWLPGKKEWACGFRSYNGFKYYGGFMPYDLFDDKPAIGILEPDFEPEYEDEWSTND
jgi:hypothetical protein